MKQRKAIQGFLTYRRRKEETDRGFIWDKEKISLLINIWANERIQQVLEICSHKRPICENIAKRLEEGSFTRSYSQVTKNIKQLEQKYKKIKDNTNVSGKNREAFKNFD